MSTTVSIPNITIQNQRLDVAKGGKWYICKVMGEPSEAILVWKDKYDGHSYSITGAGIGLLNNLKQFTVLQEIANVEVSAS